MASPLRPSPQSSDRLSDLFAGLQIREFCVQTLERKISNHVAAELQISGHQLVYAKVPESQIPIDQRTISLSPAQVMGRTKLADFYRPGFVDLHDDYEVIGTQRYEESTVSLVNEPFLFAYLRAPENKKRSKERVVGLYTDELIDAGVRLYPIPNSYDTATQGKWERPMFVVTAPTPEVTIPFNNANGTPYSTPQLLERERREIQPRARIRTTLSGRDHIPRRRDPKDGVAYSKDQG
ncbi:hypothetical protein [Parendozoicomonas haliclonae]|uniref:Uncharacterized protein n=1 Tax=Parendozoicomonas haliclonae TaxID=1960125 RepID=A0A1X7AL07_9GAMM|nr:hypothetical protein [Parendozoicomonas haliclonae]SMA47713.1 hypothetical protein EHSB41UT_02520 [Parendozoicomonas haliclonae]